MFDLFDEIYRDTEDLPKLLTIEPLLDLYLFDHEQVVDKIKFLVAQKSWRINLKLA